MKSFFGPESPLYRFMQTMTDLLVVNILWLLCSLPIITLGGATIAAYDVTMSMLRNREGHVGRQFLQSFKMNFKNGIPFGLCMLICLYIVWLNFSLFEQLPGNPIILLICGIVGAFVMVLMFLYAFPLQARYENTFFRTLKNSVDIATRYFVRTLTLLIVLALEIVVFCWSTTTLFFAILLGPACIIYTISSYANFFFHKIEQEPGAVSNPDALDNDL